MSFRKTILTMMASATILGVGANLQPTLVNARHVRTYRVNHRKARYYHNKRARRSKTVHKARRSHKIKNHKRVRKAKRVSRAHYRHRVNKPKVTKHAIHRRSHIKKYITKRYLKRTKSHYNPYARFSKAQIRAWAKIDQVPANQFIKIASNGDPSYGEPVKPYYLGGQMYLLSNKRLRYVANVMDHMSVAKYLAFGRKENPPKANKYWHADGTPTKFDEEKTDDDCIQTLNIQRTQKGLMPVTQDPNLQLIAQKRAEYMAKQPGTTDFHIDPKTKNYYISEVSQKYNIPYSGHWGENVEAGFGSSLTFYSKPWQTAVENNNSWGKYHTENRDNPDWSRAGIALVPGATVEEFSDDSTPYVH